jgi:dTDP-4-dehydrorhamnose reductase
MKVLVIGRTGQLAQELARKAWPDGWRPEFLDRSAIDLSEPETAAEAVAAREPELVINAAAYTQVDKAETEPELAMRINALAPEAIALRLAARDVPFVTISTDYVFDGSKVGPYTEADEVCPVSAYGRSKAQGERRVVSANPRHLILRTSWVFSAYGANFVKRMLRLGAERDCVSVVSDQRGRPTAAADLADAVILSAAALAQDSGVAGIYHVANAGACSWYEFAATIFRAVAARGAPQTELCPISTRDYPTDAQRPANSELATDKFERTFGIALRPWHAALDEVLDELLPA